MVNNSFYLIHRELTADVVRLYQKSKAEDEAKAATEEISGIIISKGYDSREFVLYSFAEGT